MPTARHIQKIYAQQDRILLAIKKMKSFPFVLSGGTALSRFYFHHRFSEDLDFFYEGSEFSFEPIDAVIHNLTNQAHFSCKLAGKTDRPERLRVAAYFVETGLGEPVKVDFLEDHFSGMWSPEDKKSDSGIPLRVDVLDQIYYRKLYSIIEQRHRLGIITRTKDLVDLFFLHKRHRTIENTIDYYEENNVPMNVEKLMIILSEISEKDFSGMEKMKLSSKKFDFKKAVKSFNMAGEHLAQKTLGKI